MTLKVRNAAMGDVTIETNNLTSIGDFKKKYVEELGDKGDGISQEQIRMFAMGKELKDDFFIYSYDIMNESTVQAMIKK